ncbi:MAG: polysaccharide deacetylase family protein [Actinomycetota bacterium]
MRSLIGDRNVFATKRRVAGLVGEVFRLVPHPQAHGHRTLMYHSVGLEQNSTTVDGDTLGIYSMTLAQFTAQIDVIQAVCASTGISIDVFGSAKDDSLSITFDDGYTDALTVIAPLLCARQIPFHVFVSSARMNGTDRKYLSPAQVVELSNMPGVSIGAHGASHRSLTSLSSSELAAEIRASKVDLETVLQKPVTTMSYPFGHVDESVCKATHDAGFIFAATSKWGFNEASSDPLLQRRIDMWSGDSKRTVENKVLGHWNWFGLLT